ncbi:MAG TPA: decarboxylating 6-phosphogluconate dehydrogenase [Gammaproteobacteria bacterium]|nr:decarboxylating 6-phosphogluconate dehydrogenase [Gammaproteobacteria bacterium]
MQIGIVGTGRMGGNMARRLMDHGHDCAVLGRRREPVAKLEEAGAAGFTDTAAFVRHLEPPRAVWVMVPAGAATDEVLGELAGHLAAGDCIIDGGNSHYREAVRRAGELAEHAIDFLDVGTSGGVWGRERGYCLMIGGPDEAVRRLEPVFHSLAPGVEAAGRTPGRDGDPAPAEQGYLHCGPSGAGHYVKMVHNGIEYGVMQAYAEGFDLLRAGDRDQVAEDERFDLDPAAIAEVWRRGSVIGSWLLDLSAAALHKDADLDAFSGRVADSGEGRWTVQAAVDRAVPADVLSAALYARFRSRLSPTYGDRLLSAMRRQFGGHGESDREG